MSNEIKNITPSLRPFYFDFRHEAMYFLNSIIPAAVMIDTCLTSEGTRVLGDYKEGGKQLVQDAQHLKDLFDATSDSQVSTDSRQFLAIVEEMFRSAYHMESQVSAMIQIDTEHSDTLPDQCSGLVSILHDKNTYLLKCLDDARIYLRNLT